MIAKVKDWYTDIYLTKEEIKSSELCNIGQKEKTCIWLIVGPDGFECTYYHKPHALLDRFLEGKTIAKKDGCDFVKNEINPSEIGCGKFTFNPLKGD